MGVIQTLLGQKTLVAFRLNDTQGTVFSLDASVSESHTRESPASEYEIENGTLISDNILIRPFKLQITGVISDTPINLGSQLLTTAVSIATPPPGVLVAAAGSLLGSSLSSALLSGTGRSNKAFAQLLALQESRNPFTVVTSLRSYPSMWIDSITVPRDPTTGQILLFTANLKQLRIVSPQTVVVQVFANPAVGANQANVGKQQLNQAVSQFQAGQAAEAAAVSPTLRNVLPPGG